MINVYRAVLGRSGGVRLHRHDSAYSSKSSIASLALKGFNALYEALLF